MNINKVYWHSNNGKVNLTVPLQKIDAENRTVSGFATLDNVDEYDDVVSIEGSIKAFQQFRGNLREMHQPIAVGKVKAFAPETFYDPETQKYYNGIFVDAYISKGAPDTWEKILDGTLTGFSIGGRVIKAEPVWDAELQKTINHIKELQLDELSVVDNPANQLANILAIQKSLESDEMQKVTSEHVFTCKTCKTIIASPIDHKSCPTCDVSMTDIGWIERDAEVYKAITKMVDNFYTSDEESENSPLPETDEKTSEGDINMANEEHVEEPIAEESEVEQPEAVAEEVVEPEAEVTEDVEAVAENIEAEATDSDDEGEAVAGAEEQEVSDFDRVIAELSDLRATLEQIVARASSQEESSEKATADMSKSVDEKIDALETKLTGVIESIAKSIDGVNERINEVANATAVKKSGDLGSEPETIKKSMWNGHFLGISSLEN